MSFNLRLSNELGSRMIYDKIDIRLNQKNPTTLIEKNFKLSKKLSLPSIQEFQNCNNKTNVENNIPQCRLDNTKSSTYIFNGSRSRNCNALLSTIQPHQSSLSFQSLIQYPSSMHKVSSLINLDKFTKPKKAKSKINRMFDKIFKIDDNFTKKVNNLKFDKKIALKNDFDLHSYQNKLVRKYIFLLI